MKNISSIAFGSIIAIGIALTLMPRSGEVETVPVMNEVTTKVFQIGAYKEKDTALEYALKNNAKVVFNDGYYYIYLSILSDQENIEKMISYLNSNNIYYYIKNLDTTSTFKEELVKYEELMKQTSSDIAFIELNKRIMDLYEVAYEN